MALQVAQALDAPLDVIVVRKLGVPFQPELGMGAVGEDGVRVINTGLVRVAGVSEDELAAAQAREKAQTEAAPPGWESGFRGEADELACVDTPARFEANGQFHADFSILRAATGEDLRYVRIALARCTKPLSPFPRVSVGVPILPCHYGQR